jgi:thymidylate synthase (FAD)
MDPHAQAEIRSYAAVIGNEIVARWVPFVWEAFLDYGLNSVHLSASEVRIVANLLMGNLEGARSCAASLGWLDREGTGDALRRDRERDEFVAKLSQRFGFSSDWLKSPTVP